MLAPPAISHAGSTFFVDPAAGSFRLFRRDGPVAAVDLAPLQQSAAIRPGTAVNRLELSCAGSTISASINGVQVATAQDSAYRGGGMWFGTGTAGSAGEVRFDNLVVTQR